VTFPELENTQINLMILKIANFVTLDTRIGAIPHPDSPLIKKLIICGTITALIKIKMKASSPFKSFDKCRYHTNTSLKTPCPAASVALIAPMG
jgi:hypothetical protein